MFKETTIVYVDNAVTRLITKLYGNHESLGLKSSLYFRVNESNMGSGGFAESIGGKVD